MMQVPIANEIAAAIPQIRKALPEGVCPRLEKWMRDFESGKDRSPASAMTIASGDELALPDEFAAARDAALELLAAAIDLFGRSEEAAARLWKAKKLLDGQ